ncbi:laccase-7-like [Macadamia integrifolia]|uniref:laccase-7-like n=1 Tax=Macadamia integrifolia TaxID=60698 RepID=UPI001C4F98DD|nr:laccase-7-like [Macadamia integrifolia]
MGRSMLLVACAFTLLLASVVSSSVVEHTLVVKNRMLRRLCYEQEVTVVNGSMPGPVIRVRDGDTLIVHVLNQSPINISLHWHGLFQRRSGWADGAAYITQCPLVPGSNYTYKFNITDQQGTLWWHEHRDLSRATIYGAFIIHPRHGKSYPFPKPDKEVPILFGEWWNASITDVDNQGFLTGLGPNLSDALTINGKPGDLYPCPKKDTFKLKVKPDNVYLLRLVNAAVNTQLFFKIANHNLTVVAVDASYTEPYSTDVVVSGPGQTVDVLLIANKPPKSYYMAIQAYSSSVAAFVNTTATAIMEYEGGPTTSSIPPELPLLPPFNDTPTAYKFYSNLTSPLRQVSNLPLQVDERLFITIGMSISPCGLGGNATCGGPNGTRFSANMNGLSFQVPTKLSILQAAFSGSNQNQGVFTADFPSQPLVTFDYTNPNNTLNQTLMFSQKSTSVKKIPFNSSVEMVFQNTAVLGVENHPIHLHGYDFYVLAMGFGNYNHIQDVSKFNLFNPQMRNTVAVPAGGWAVIRFRADNPGAWIMHCHLETHLSWGLATALIVEEGPTPFYKLPPPPSDYPQC